MLSLIYLTAATFSENFEFHPVIMLALDILNTLWFFIGAVATAAILGVHSCSSSNAVSYPFRERIPVAPAF
jgi:hypothetical protein